MTCIKVKNSETDFSMQIIGHAGYADKGKDIVCAGISTLAFTFIQMLDRYSDMLTQYEYEASDGVMKISFTYINKNFFEPIISTILCGFSMLSDTYPENISLILTK